MITRTVYLLLALLLLLSYATGSATAAPADDDYIAGEVLVKLHAGTRLSPQAQPASTLAAPDRNVMQSLQTTLTNLDTYAADSLGPTSQTYRLRFRQSIDAEEAAARLDAHPLVVFAEVNARRQMLRMPNDAHVDQQWALTNIQAFEAWDITTGEGIPIAVVDTGVNADHPDLSGNVSSGYNALADNDRSDDDNGHGTAVAGLIAARTDNDRGIAGMCWRCTIVPVKVLNSRGGGSDASVAQGIRWAANAGARVINMSLGGSRQSQTLREAVEYAHSLGALLISASGNERQAGNRTSYPAAYDEVLAVGGTGNTDAVTGFSNTGDYVDIAAPSVGLWTTTVDGEYGPPNGTSFSSPYVAGTAGLVFTLRPDVSHVDIKCILEASADDKGPPGKDPEYGWGRLNALRAVQLAQTYSGCPFDQPTPPPAAPAPGGNPAFEPVPAVPNTSDLAYFPQTGHTLRGGFKRYWEQHGGLPIFGYPISEEFIERGDDGNDYLVQYFERHRFEWHPESAPPYNVQLSRLGDSILQQQGRNWFTFAKTGQVPNCLYFAETEQSVCEPFLSYWRSNGLEFDGTPGTSFPESLALFGQPLSGPQVEEVAPGVSVTVQWFERARFEDHGANGGVLLGLLASDLARARGWR